MAHYVVTLVHGDIETPGESLMLKQISTLASKLGCPVTLGTNETTEWELRCEEDSQRMMQEIHDLPGRPVWWLWKRRPGKLLTRMEHRGRTN